MRRETIAVHAGFDSDPTTHAVATPIYQTAAYAFDSADHGAALFNLEIDGFRYSRISNPTTSVLEQRVAELEGGVGAIALASGQAALYYAFVTLGRRRRQHRRDAAALRHDPLPAVARSAAPGRRGPLRRLRPGRGHRAADRCEHARGLLRERRQPRRQHLRHRGDRGRGAPPWRAADRRQHRSDAGSAAPDRVRGGHRRPLADQVHGRPWHDPRRRGCRFRPFRLGGQRRPLPDVQRAGRVLSRPRLRRPLRAERVRRPHAQRLSAHDRGGAGALERLPSAAGHRDRRAPRRASRRERPRALPNSCAPTRAWTG